MHIPKNCLTLDQVKDIPQIRLGIQGYGGVGKTWAAMTFPNPCVINFDRSLGAFLGRKDIVEVPMYSSEFCTTVNANFKPNLGMEKDVLILWLENHANKLESDQTLVLDGGTGLGNIYHKWYSFNQVATSRGGINDFAEWTLKLTYMTDIFEKFKTLKCHCVFLYHETDQKDKKTQEYTGKIRPLVTGQFADQLLTHSTDWFRQQAAAKPDVTTLDEAKLARWKMSKSEFKSMCDSFPGNTIYYWQTEGDDKFDGKASSLINFPTFMPANYDSMRKYMRPHNNL